MRARKIEMSSGPGAHGRIVVDGVDLSGATRAVWFSHRAGNVPEVTVDLLAFETTIDGEATLSIPARTREALIVLGWTPPAEEDTVAPIEQATP